MVELTIDSLGGRGDGIAQDIDGVVYIPYAAPGDHVSATVTGKRGAARLARLDAVLAPGPDRVAPLCTHFGTCGGCALQHISAPAYQAWKSGILRQALSHQGLDDTVVEDMVTVPMASRRRARFAARRTKGGIRLGFNAAGSHMIVDLTECHILRPAIVALLAGLRALLADILPGGGKADVQVTETETGLDVWLVADIPHQAQTDMRLADFAQDTDLARLSTGRRPQVVMVQRAPQVTLSDVKVTPPPDGFLQASLDGERALVDLVAAGVGSAARVADLFAGIGTFSFALARRAQVLAVEGDEEQAQALTASRNAARLNGLEIEVRDLQRRSLNVEELNAFDAVVFDPPRAGAQNQAEALAASKVERVVAVSCNPATFARDARCLVDGGYQLRKITPVDQFPWSRHLELVACFQR